MFNKKCSLKILLPYKGEQKHFKGRGQTENRAVDCAATVDQADHQPNKRFKRQIEEDFVDNSSESDDESIRAEQEKVEKLILNLGKKASIWCK